MAIKVPLKIFSQTTYWIAYSMPSLCYQELNLSINWVILSLLNGVFVSQQFFSSTGRRPASYCHGIVSVMRPSVCLAVCPSVRASVRASVNSSFKKLLRNYLLDFYEILQECFMGGPLSNSFK